MEDGAGPEVRAVRAVRAGHRWGGLSALTRVGGRFLGRCPRLPSSLPPSLCYGATGRYDATGGWERAFGPVAELAGDRRFEISNFKKGQ